MQRIDILRAWDAEVEREWIGLIDATVAALDNRASMPSELADMGTIRALQERTIVVGRRRGELWRQISELEGCR